MDALVNPLMVPPKPPVAWTTHAIAFSLNFRFGITFLLLAVAVLNGIAIHHLTDEQGHYADIIGVAGRLRMLSQRLAADTFYTLANPIDQHGKVATDIEEFESGLDAVERSGQAYSYLVKRLPGALEPRSFPSALSRLVDPLWRR